MTVLYAADCLQVVGLWFDLSEQETLAASSRESTLLLYISKLQNKKVTKSNIRQWAQKLEKLADAIPDTHGLLIHETWTQLPSKVQCLVSPNHASWNTFCTALKDIDPANADGTPPDTLPLPWHRQRLEAHIPYSISDRPSTSGLVVRLTHSMPQIFRGINPDPAKRKRKKNTCGGVESHAIADQDSDYDEDDSSSEIDFSRYFWPSFTLPSLLHSSSLSGIGLKLVGLVYDARKTILDLGVAFLEVEPLLHTSPQIYTIQQWTGVIRVPKAHRKFKIGFALEFRTHVLSWNSFDNNFRINWRTPSEHALFQAANHVPDPVYNYAQWCQYTAEWLSTSKPSNETILESITASGRQPFRGLGKYSANEVLSIGGLPPWTPMWTVLSDGTLFAILCESFVQFVTMHAVGIEEYREKAFNHNDPNDFSLNVTQSQQLDYAKTLRTHGRMHTYMTASEAILVDKYNEASSRTWTTEFFDARTDMSKVTIPFELTNVRSAVLRFGHLGPSICREWWPSILQEMNHDANTLRLILKEYDKLAQRLDRDTLLSFKPTFLLSEQEIDQLTRVFGWAENPIATFFSKKRHNVSVSSRIATQCLSLTGVRSHWRDTHYIQFEKGRNSYLWSTLKPPFISSATRARTKTKRAEVQDTPLFIVQSLADKKEASINYRKQSTQKWTVGPHDFVGHAQVIKNGKMPPFSAMCSWHRDLTAHQAKLVHVSQEIRSRYPRGYRKLSILHIIAEKAWRAKVVSALTKERGKTAVARMTSLEISKHIRLRRKQERSDLKMNGTLGSRVTVHSRVYSMSRKWGFTGHRSSAVNL
ncbi:hypothetical protein MSAN_02103400 [Mycena sanguinolenta]|uniref:Uncharacterized protein n=1 Tax=Mycena sanguinolenta TaxID=230812 RepID=A0A8H7CKC4_9AGAR|nr:hypothetical protein MSAN_02103400 [Mycena sanguinolenta]